MESENSQILKVTTEAPIAFVTVYPDRAQVVRKGSVQLPVGTCELVIENLPTNLDADSLRARGSGEVAVKILGVESREVFLTEDNHQEARETQRELDALEAAGTALTHQQEALEQRLATIREMSANAAKSYAKGLAVGHTSLQLAGETLDFLQEQNNQVHRANAELAAKKRENAAEQLVLMNRLKQLRGARQSKTHHVVVAVESSGAGQWNVELSYVVTGASWKPLYDARVLLTPPSIPEAELQGKLALSYLASITQRTGEDWNEAAIALSTARPSLGSLPPKLEPIYVDISRGIAHIKKTRVRAVSEGNDESTVDSEIEEMLGMMAPAEDFTARRRAQAPEPIEAEVETAAVSSEGATVTFELPRRLNVPSDGQPHRAMIAYHEFPCKLDYVAVPRRSEWAYLRATIKNESTLSLLAGEANVFRDEMFIGKTKMQPVAPHEEWKIFLGPDEQVRAKRELTRRDVDKTLIGNTRRLHYGHKIDVENLKPHRVSLMLLDQIPVSRHEQIKVKLKNAEPMPHMDDLGIFTWELNLGAHSKRDVHYDSVIESPRDMQITGQTD